MLQYRWFVIFSLLLVALASAGVVLAQGTNPKTGNVPDRIAGREVLLVKTPDNSECLGKSSMDLVLRASEPTIADLHAGRGVEDVMRYLQEKGFPEDTGVSFAGPGIDKGQLEREHAQWNAVRKAHGCIRLVGQTAPMESLTQVVTQPGFAIVRDTEITVFSNHNAQSVELLAPIVGNNQLSYSALLNNGWTSQLDLLQDGFVFELGSGWVVWTDEAHFLNAQSLGISYQAVHWYWFTVTRTSNQWQLCGYDIFVGLSTYVCQLSPNTQGTTLTGGDNTSVWFENWNSNSDWSQGFSNPVYAALAKNYVNGIPSVWTSEMQKTDSCGTVTPDPNPGTIGGTLVNDGTATFNLPGVPLGC